MPSDKAASVGGLFRSVTATVTAEGIMASGHVNRIYRPNTWQHRPSLRREDFSCQPGAVHTRPHMALFGWARSVLIMRAPTFPNVSVFRCYKCNCELLQSSDP